MTEMGAKKEADGSRTLVDDVVGWIRIYSDGSVERPGPPAAAPFMAVVPPYAEPRGGVTVHDVPTGQGVDVRLYLPEWAPRGPSSGGRPVLVHFHGGGFCVSHPSWSLYHHFYAPLVAKLDVAGIVSVVLPLAPEHRLPAAIDAGYAALLWLRDVARSSNVDDGAHPAVKRLRDAADFSRVFLIGDSSGGNLVHLVAARAGQAGAGLLDPVRLAGGVLLHAGFARSEKSRSERENPPGPFMSHELVDKLMPLALPAGATKDHPYTSPVEAARAVEHVQVPPMLVMVAEQDLLRDPQVEYAEAMARAGKAVEVVVGRGVGHIFYTNWFAVESDRVTSERAAELVGAVKNFIDGH